MLQLMIHTQCDVAVIVLVDGLSLELYIQVGTRVLHVLLVTVCK